MNPRTRLPDPIDRMIDEGSPVTIAREDYPTRDEYAKVRCGICGRPWKSHGPGTGCKWGVRPDGSPFYHHLDEMDFDFCVDKLTKNRKMFRMFHEVDGVQTYVGDMEAYDANQAAHRGHLVFGKPGKYVAVLVTEIGEESFGHFVKSD